MKITIVGYGRVGKAVEELLGDHYVLATDSYEGDLGIVCVPTPSKEDGSCDTSIVEEVVGKLRTKLILIKSTVEPGTTDKLIEKTGKRIVFSPEYIGESKYYNPYFNERMLDCPYVVLGGSNRDCNVILDVLVPVMGPTKTYYKTTSLNAEIIKYMENAFFATKVAFVNEMYEICKSLGADWHSVREGWLLDPRVNKMHTAVIKKGYSGKCFPKDIKALIKVAESKGYKSELLKKVDKWSRKS